MATDEHGQVPSPERPRELGEQPLAKLLQEGGVDAKQLVAASTQGLTFKMVTRACKGRWLTAKVKGKLLEAARATLGPELRMRDLFNY
jgi:hypothetical protein